MNTELMFSSKTDQWATPQNFYNELDKEFRFNLDPCADEYNHKCDKWFSAEQDGLSENWGGTGCFAIRHMGGNSGDGLKRHTRKVTKKILLYVC